jgi:hypothetical protein
MDITAQTIAAAKETVTGITAWGLFVVVLSRDFV